eukprot:2103588-Prorocentrum_lima.AAC.1
MKKAVTLERKQASKQACQRFGEASSSHQQHCTPKWEWIEADTARIDGAHGIWTQPMTMGRVVSA